MAPTIGRLALDNRFHGSIPEDWVAPPPQNIQPLGEIVLVTDAAAFVGKKNYSGKLFCFHRFFCVDDKLHKIMQRISAQRHWKC